MLSPTLYLSFPPPSLSSIIISPPHLLTSPISYILFIHFHVIFAPSFFLSPTLLSIPFTFLFFSLFIFLYSFSIFVLSPTLFTISLPLTFLLLSFHPPHHSVNIPHLLHPLHSFSFNAYPSFYLILLSFLSPILLSKHFCFLFFSPFIFFILSQSLFFPLLYSPSLSLSLSFFYHFTTSC